MNVGLYPCRRQIAQLSSPLQPVTPLPSGNWSGSSPDSAARPASDGLRQSDGNHDFTTFATHRLTAWYRAGANVQAMLPLLATYLGHLNVSGTQAYLTMTPELLAEASQRFENYASVVKEISHE